MKKKRLTGRPRVGIYCRLSEEDRDKAHKGDDSNSIVNQKAILLQHCAEQDWDVYDIYVDDDFGGGNRDRPDFKRILKDCEDGELDIVLCKHQSRFTRELEAVELIIHRMFIQWGVRFVSLVDGADTNNESNYKARQINGLINEWYLSDLSANIKKTLTNRRQNGFHIGAFAPYGYKKDPEKKGHLIIDGPAAEIVRLIFKLFEDGWGKTAIARYLNNKGVPNPTEYKRLQGIRTKAPEQTCSTLWKYSTIADILCNPVYAGHLVQGKYKSISWKTRSCKPTSPDEWIRVENTHEPIIDNKQWEAVQKIIRDKAKPFSTTGKVGLFSRTAHCAHCGYTLTTSKSKDNRSYLQCPNHHIAKDACIGCFISVQKLEQLVLDEFVRLSDEFAEQSEFDRWYSFKSELEEERTEIKTTIEHHKQQVDECSRAIKNLLISNARGIVSEADLQEATQELKQERDRHILLIAEGERQLEEIDQKIADGDNRKAIFEKYAYIDHLDREFVETMIESITVSKRIAGTKIVPFKVKWKF